MPKIIKIQHNKNEPQYFTNVIDDVMVMLFGYEFIIEWSADMKSIPLETIITDYIVPEDSNINNYIKTKK
ncbi:MAG: hypothetical protein HC892_14460 [Saprospiraceae bacterium]|nr:hypothetical protein [Saprospiraceae bacterium]